ncbi:hypothetical protein NFI96_017379 [Prochilodus magdalenae]|nr:hypothetical protein NFI96_017379 [Prochilodus magdalenae]
MCLTLVKDLGGLAFEMAALGRPLYPGMLYDCRSDSFIPGVTLWDEKALREDLDVHPCPQTDLKFSASESLSDKVNLLDVDASLKASFMAGMVKVNGSAKYLHDTKSSAHQERLTLHYSQTTRFEQLTMTELGKITYPQVLDRRTATHVITAVLYGAQAFMVFDHTLANDEDKQEVKGNLNVLIKKFPSLSIDAKADLKLNDSEKKMAENLSVTFHGDYGLEQNPTTFKEALDIYKKLPHLLGEKGSNAVPVRVWLYPLKLLSDKAAVLVREVNEGLVSSAEYLLEELEDAERRCNDLMKGIKVLDLLDLKGWLQMIRGYCSDYKIAFQKALSRILPAIREGKHEELVLTNLLRTHLKSPFSARNLNKWLDNISKEMCIVGSHISKLENVKVVTSLDQLHTILADPAVDVVVCLCFTSLKYQDTYLDALKEFVDSAASVNPEEPSRTDSIQVTEPWFMSSGFLENLRQNLSLFTSFSKTNKNDTRLHFVIASISDSTCPGVSIQLYEEGKLKDPNFQPVTKPPPPIVEIHDGAVTLKLQKLPTGETLRFRVKYRIVNAGEAYERPKWETKETPDAQQPLVLTGLQPDKQYLIQYEAVSTVGVSEPSDAVYSQTASPNACTLVGGSGGKENVFGDDIGVTLKKIRVSLGSSMVDAVEVFLSNQQHKFYGSMKGTPFQEFVFHAGDRFRFLTLWPNICGDRLGGIHFEVVRITGRTDSFCAKISDVGQPVSIDVGLGVCHGVKVMGGGDVDALGFFLT